MKQFGGWHFPDGETHLIDWLKKAGVEAEGRQAYQWKKMQAALAYVQHWRTAIDIGAHIGLWSFYLAKRFETVVAFEPMAAHRECFKRNVPSDNVMLVPTAVGEHAGNVAMKTFGVSTGDTHVDPDKRGDVEMVTLDTMPLLDGEQIDFIKLDCEGYELFALRGAEKLLLRCKPVVIVEQKPGRAEKYGLPRTGAVDYLKGLGYQLRAEMSGDFVLSAA